MQSLFRTLHGYKYTDFLQHNRITAVLKKDVETIDNNDRIINIPAGTKVRIWTTSRFGWAGITQNLGDDCIGYEACLGGEPGTRNPGELEDYFDEIILEGRV